ncbi:MAG: septum formation initiator family protein [Actinomycetota bacterium]|nr:septum formation initiator family protein [Actinomycetota bacterium]
MPPAAPPATVRRRAGSVLVAKGMAVTGRAAILGLAVLAVALTLAYPLRQYLSQRGELAELEKEHAAAVAEVGRLAEQRRQLDDPDRIRAMARSRLNYAMPGERVYRVTGTPPAPPPAPLARAEAVAAGTWYERLWVSTQIAGQPPALPPK